MRGRAVDEVLARGEKAPRAEQGRPLVQDHQEGRGVHEAEEPLLGHRQGDRAVRAALHHAEGERGLRPARGDDPPARAGIGSLQNLQPFRAHSRLIWPSYANLRGTGVANSPHEEEAMLWTIFVILVIMWLLGMVSSYTLGGFLHLLLVLAIAVVLIRIIQGRRPI